VVLRVDAQGVLTVVEGEESVAVAPEAHVRREHAANLIRRR
jgi:hypothetical protein